MKNLIILLFFPALLQAQQNNNSAVSMYNYNEKALQETMLQATTLSLTSLQKDSLLKINTMFYKEMAQLNAQTISPTQRGLELKAIEQHRTERLNLLFTKEQWRKYQIIVQRMNERSLRYHDSLAVRKNRLGQQ